MAAEYTLHKIAHTWATLSNMITSLVSASRLSSVGPHIDMVPPYLHGKLAERIACKQAQRGQARPYCRFAKEPHSSLIYITHTCSSGSPHEQQQGGCVRRCARRDAAVGQLVVAHRHKLHLSQEAQVLIVGR